MRIEYLCDCPGVAPALAAAHTEAFRALLRDWSEAEALDELRTHTARRAIPTTLVAREGADWLGSVSLLQNDNDDIREFSPWLASLYVRPEARRKGLGRTLVTRCVDEAAALQVPVLYLYCHADLVPFYRDLGWSLRQRVTLAQATVQVLSIAPDPGRDA